MQLLKVKTLSRLYFNNKIHEYGEVIKIPIALYKKLSNSFILLDNINNDDALKLKAMENINNDDALKLKAMENNSKKES